MTNRERIEAALAELDVEVPHIRAYTDEIRAALAEMVEYMDEYGRLLRDCVNERDPLRLECEDKRAALAEMERDLSSARGSADFWQTAYEQQSVRMRALRELRAKMREVDSVPRCQHGALPGSCRSSFCE